VLITALSLAFALTVCAWVIVCDLKQRPRASKAETRARIGQLIYQFAFWGAVGLAILAISAAYRQPYLFPSWLGLVPIAVMALGMWLIGLILRFVLRGKKPNEATE
jgi:hypothetical protein